MKYKSSHWILIVLVLSTFCQCQKHAEELRPEEKLLNLFRHELQLVEQHQEDYVSYMIWQVEHFKDKQKLTGKLIQQINEHYQGLSENEQSEYMIYWQRQYQPVIDAIYANTRNMILNQTKELNSENMARIQEMSIKMEILEKEAPSSKLIPQFFIEPMQ